MQLVVRSLVTAETGSSSRKSLQPGILSRSGQRLLHEAVLRIYLHRPRSVTPLHPQYPVTPCPTAAHSQGALTAPATSVLSQERSPISRVNRSAHRLAWGLARATESVDSGPSQVFEKMTNLILSFTEKMGRARFFVECLLYVLA